MYEDFYSWTATNKKSPWKLFDFPIMKTSSHPLPIQPACQQRDTKNQHKNKSPKGKYEPCSQPLRIISPPRFENRRRQEGHTVRNRISSGKEEEKRRKGDIWRGTTVGCRPRRRGQQYGPCSVQ